jgi:hypothetical protein
VLREGVVCWRRIFSLLVFVSIIGILVSATGHCCVLSRFSHPRGSLASRGRAAQTANGVTKVRAPGLTSSAAPVRTGVRSCGLTVQGPFSFPKLPYRLWGQPILFFSGCRRLFSEVKRPGRKAGYLFAYSAEVKNEWTYTAAHLRSVDRGFACLFMSLYTAVNVQLALSAVDVTLLVHFSGYKFDYVSQ